VSGTKLRSSAGHRNSSSRGIADHRLIESFVASRESSIFETLPDAFAGKIADRVRLLAEGCTQLVGLLSPPFPSQSKDQPSCFNHVTSTVSARQLLYVDIGVIGTFGDELFSRQITSLRTGASSASSENVNV
jgi:hypothetical protein